MDEFKLGDKSFSSRLLLGTALYSSPEQMFQSLEKSGCEIITLSIRRINLDQIGKTFLSDERLKKYHWLPNTAGCFTAKEAILTAELAREALEINWVKLEVIGDDFTLLPDSIELITAARELVENGFIVLPYCNDDPIICKKLEQVGCSAVMPLAAPIGSGLGIRNPHNLELIKASVDIPVIVDAGIGTASDAALAMELGCDAILLNTAIAHAIYPEMMATAMRNAVEAGRLAYLAGRIPKSFQGNASSPLEGKIGIL